MCGMPSLLTAVLGVTPLLKKLTAFLGFKVLPSFCCHVFKEVIVLGISFDRPAILKVAEVPWKTASHFSSLCL